LLFILTITTQLVVHDFRPSQAWRIIIFIHLQVNCHCGVWSQKLSELMLLFLCVFLEWGVTPKLSSFQYKLWRTADNQNLIHSLNFFSWTVTISVAGTGWRIGCPSTMWVICLSCCF
jgi:hypothetical protein